MGAIDIFLEHIRHAVYGKDVRESIASGIEQCYHDSTANAQMEAIEEKGAEVLASIPDDYTELSEDVAGLKSAFAYTNINNFVDGNKTLPVVFIRGSRSNLTGKYGTADYRITTSDTFEVDKDVLIMIRQGFTLRLYRVTGVDQVIKEDFTGYTNLIAGREYYATIMRTTEDQTEVADIAEFASAVYAYDNVNNKLADNMAYTGMLANGNFTGKILIPSAFLRGLLTNTDAFIPADYSIYTPNKFTFEYNTTFTIAPGFTAKALLYNKDTGTVRTNTGWKVGTIGLTPNYDYRIIIKRADAFEDQTEVANIAEFAGAVYVADTGGTEYLPHAFTHGTFNGNGVISAETYRIYTPDMFTVDKRITYQILSGYRVRVTRYDKTTDTRVDTPSWVTGSVTLSPNYKYRMTIARATDDTSETADILAFQRQVYRTPLKTNKHLSILIIGNSHSSDSWVYVPFILKNYGITCEIYWSYRGAGSLDRWVAEWTDRDDRGYDPWGGTHVRRFTHIDTRYTDSWDDVEQGYSTKDVVEMASAIKLDLIVIQSVTDTQAESRSENRLGIEPSMRQLLSLITESYTRPFVLGWFTSIPVVRPINYGGYNIPTADRDDRIGLIKTTEAVMANEPVDLLFPVGTAVINARTNSDLSSKNVSNIGNLFYTDGLHLQHGVPCYIANATIVESLFRKFFPEYSILNDQTRVRDDTLHTTTWRCPFEANHGSIKQTGTDEQLYKLAQKCAISACNNPYDITPMYSYDSTSQIKTIGTYDQYWADELITRPDPGDIGNAGADT